MSPPATRQGPTRQNGGRPVGRVALGDPAQAGSPARARRPTWLDRRRPRRRSGPESGPNRFHLQALARRCGRSRQRRRRRARSGRSVPTRSRAASDNSTSSSSSGPTAIRRLRFNRDSSEPGSNRESRRSRRRSSSSASATAPKARASGASTTSSTSVPIASELPPQHHELLLVVTGGRVTMRTEGAGARRLFRLLSAALEAQRRSTTCRTSSASRCNRCSRRLSAPTRGSGGCPAHGRAADSGPGEEEGDEALQPSHRGGQRG